MLRTISEGDFRHTMKFLEFLKSDRLFHALDKYGEQGVRLLQQATPKETTETANSWYFRVEHSKGKHVVWWGNTHEEDGVNIAIIIQYGHGTGTGGYVAGRDYINPALRPLFDKMADDIWREVQSA